MLISVLGRQLTTGVVFHYGSFVTFHPGDDSHNTEQTSGKKKAWRFGVRLGCHTIATSTQLQ